MAPSVALDKVMKKEVETLAALELKYEGAQNGLTRHDAGTPLLSERQVESHIKGLENAYKIYESSIAAIVAAAGEEQGTRKDYMKKLDEWLIKVDPALDKLYALLKKYKAASNAPPEGDASNQTKAIVQMKLTFARNQIESRLNLIRTAEADEEVRTSPLKLCSYLRQLDDAQKLLKS